jgi:hypothetical protein
VDLTLRFNIYTSGSWGIQGDTRYNQRYKYNGNLNLLLTTTGSRKTIRPNGYRPNRSVFAGRTNRTPRRTPTRKFGGSVNIETNRDQNRNRNDYASVYQNQLSSNLNYSQTFPGRPYQFNASLSHSQNTQTRLMNISFPTAAFNLQRIYPLKRKNPVGRERWYEKISLTYASRLQNTVQVADTLLFTSETLQRSRMGLQHQASTDFNFKLFRYINIAPRVNYEENWYPYTIQREFIDQIKYVYDTVADIIVVDSSKTQWGRDTSFRDWGFKPFRQYDIGITANTALFFTKQFKKGWFRGIRHTMKPSISTGFRPDYSGSDYFRQVQTASRPGRETFQNYGIFDEAVYGRPSSAPARPGHQLQPEQYPGNEVFFGQKGYGPARAYFRQPGVFGQLQPDPGYAEMEPYQYRGAVPPVQGRHQPDLERDLRSVYTERQRRADQPFCRPGRRANCCAWRVLALRSIPSYRCAICANCLKKTAARRATKTAALPAR